MEKITFLLLRIIIVGVYNKMLAYQTAPPPSSQPVLDPPVSTEIALHLNDADRGTCLTLNDTHFYTFDAVFSFWQPEPQDDCWMPGLMIKKPVANSDTISHKVTISGRSLICSLSQFQVLMRLSSTSSCGVAGNYTICMWDDIVEEEGMNKCVADCSCEGDDCSYVIVHIPKAHVGWEICEINVE